MFILVQLVYHWLWHKFGLHILQVDSLKAKLLEKLEQSLDGLQIKPEEASTLVEDDDSSNDTESNDQHPAKIHEVNTDYVASLSFVFLMNASWNTVKLTVSIKHFEYPQLLYRRFSH